jgi:hypothetical protein
LAGASAAAELAVRWLTHVAQPANKKHKRKGHMTVTKTIGLAIIPASLTGCCLHKVTITPEMSTVDLKAATAGNAKVGIDILFKDCCPTKEQKALAL